MAHAHPLSWSQNLLQLFLKTKPWHFDCCKRVSRIHPTIFLAYRTVVWTVVWSRMAPLIGVLSISVNFSLSTIVRIWPNCHDVQWVWSIFQLTLLWLSRLSNQCSNVSLCSWTIRRLWLEYAYRQAESCPMRMCKTSSRFIETLKHKAIRASERIL